MARRSLALAPTLESIINEAAADVEASVAVVDSESAMPPIWEPLPGPQRLAYESLADEVFYGGAGGCGKSSLEIGLAITKHRRSIIFRREGKQLRGVSGLIEKSKEFIGFRGDLNEGPTPTWKNLPGGRTLEFGSMQLEGDWRKYQGHDHDLKAFDELPEFTESQYRSSLGWMRTTVVGQRVRALGTGNPPTTEEGKWVIRYWAPWLDDKHPNPAKPGELRYYANIDGIDVERENGEPFMHNGDRIVPRSRTFIPGKVEDNPYYMRTGYDQVLNSLPEPLRSQVRHGDFRAGVTDDPWQVIPTAWIMAAQERWKPDGGSGIPIDAYGADPARGGPAEFVIANRRRWWIGPLVIHPGALAPNGPKGANLIFKAMNGDKTISVQIDIIGTAGASVYDQCITLGMTAHAFNGSMKSIAKDKSAKLGFVNQRAELYWGMRELLDPESGVDMALPPDPQMRADLCAPKWHPTPQGIKIESKDDIIKRLGRSPDRGEAVIYCCVRPMSEVIKKFTRATWGR